MNAKCIQDIHFRLHIYTICTWLIILGCAIKPCIVGLHVQSKMNVLSTFGSHEMGGGDTSTYYTFFNCVGGTPMPSITKHKLLKVQQMKILDLAPSINYCIA